MPKDGWEALSTAARDAGAKVFDTEVEARAWYMAHFDIDAKGLYDYHDCQILYHRPDGRFFVAGTRQVPLECRANIEKAARHQEFLLSISGEQVGMQYHVVYQRGRAPLEPEGEVTDVAEDRSAETGYKLLATQAEAEAWWRDKGVVVGKESRTWWQRQGLLTAAQRT
jgi:hypothetical protein